MPHCTFMNLREPYLDNVNFQHEPIELTNMPYLSTLVLDLFIDITVELYKQLPCKLTLPSLENICINNGGGLWAAVRDYGCGWVDSMASYICLTW